MISWIIVGLLIVAALLLLKFKEVRHRLGLFVLILILLFFIITAGSVYSQNKDKADLKTFEGVSYVGKIYFAWLGQLFGNVKELTGYAIQKDWGINSTNLTSIKR